MPHTSLPETAVAEIVTFSLNAGISDAEFVALSQSSQAFVAAAPGFLTRQLSKGEDGTWTDYVLWADADTAHAAAAQFPEQDFAPALIAAIDPATVKLRHEAVTWAMQTAA